MESETRVANFTRNLDSRIVLACFFVVIGQVAMAVQYLLVRLSARTVHYDVKVKWLPIAEQLANGRVLYLTTTFDNKTPLWHALNFLVYRTGHYVVAFYLLVGLANAAIAYLLWEWLRREGKGKAGIVAGGSYLAASPVVLGTVINVRSFAMVLVLLALLTRRAAIRGAFTAVAVLFSQFSVLAIPVLLYDGWRRSGKQYDWACRYLVAGAATGVVAYLPLVLVWSPEAAVAGVKATFLEFNHCAFEKVDNFSPYNRPRMWAVHLLEVAQKLLVLLVGAAGAVAYRTLRSGWTWDAFTKATVLAALFTATLLVKSLAYYWLPPVVFLSVLLGTGLTGWIATD